MANLISCNKLSPADSVIALIDATEKKLYDATSIEEMQQIQYELLDNITNTLNAEHDGYRFVDLFVFKGKLSIQKNVMYYVQIAFFVLAMSGLLSEYILTPAVSFVYSLLCQPIGLII